MLLFSQHNVLRQNQHLPTTNPRIPHSSSSSTSRSTRKRMSREQIKQQRARLALKQASLSSLRPLRGRIHSAIRSNRIECKATQTLFEGSVLYTVGNNKAFSAVDRLLLLLSSRSSEAFEAAGRSSTRQEQSRQQDTSTHTGRRVEPTCSESRGKRPNTRRATFCESTSSA